MDTRWIHPFAAIISGPSGCGKSTFVKRFLAQLDRMCTVRFARVLLYYGEWQEAYGELSNSVNVNVEFHEGLPQSSDFSLDPENAKLVIVDDLMREAGASGGSSIVDLFTKGSHHRNLSVMFLTQNLFHQGPGQRSVSLNAHYILAFKSPRDRSQIYHLARQVYPEDPRVVQEAYFDSTTNTPYGYLLLDLKQTTPENCRLRSCIFPDDPHHYVYVSKRALKNRSFQSQVPVVRL